MIKSLNEEYSSEINRINTENSTKIRKIELEKEIALKYKNGQIEYLNSEYTSELNKIKAEKEKLELRASSLEEEIDRKTTCIICCEKYNDS